MDYYVPPLSDQWARPTKQKVGKVDDQLAPDGDNVALGSTGIQQASEESDGAGYSLDDAMEKGLFINRDVFGAIVERLRTKKNVILQGPPGVGKTFFSHQVAYVLMNSKDRDRVSMIQFHPSYTYEDFVQGFRPSQLPQCSIDWQ